MKTNHRRGFKANKPRNQAMWGDTMKLASGRIVGVSIGNDFTDGHQGMARAKRGAKKRLRVLDRLDGKLLVRQARERVLNGEED